MRRLLVTLSALVAVSATACAPTALGRRSTPPPGQGAVSPAVATTVAGGGPTPTSVPPTTAVPPTVVPPTTAVRPEPSVPRTTNPTDYAYEFCSNADEAIAYVIGVVWADGGIAGDTAHARLPSDARADAAEAAGRCAGIDVSRTRDGGVWDVRFPGLRGADVNHAGMPPMLVVDRSVDFEITMAFLAGVIEGEGGRTSGLVVDDTHDGHLYAVPPLLDRLGLRWCLEGNKLYVDREDWPAFAAFPFAVFDRVPGYGITWC